VKAHSAPITNVHCHPLHKSKPGASNLANFYLTSSYDWTVKLWNSKLKRPLLTFESSRDYVYDVQWSPSHPAVFASGDGTGKIDVWNLNTDTEVPMYTTKIPEAPGAGGEIAALSRLRWSHDGKYLAAGTSTGNVHLYEVSSEIASPGREASDTFYDKIARWTSAGQATKEDESLSIPARALSPSGSSSGGSSGSTSLGLLDKPVDSELIDHKENN
jgi:dynein intermediate chain